MRYTYRKISGMLALLLGIMLISRFSPDWLFYMLLSIAGLLMLYLIYCYTNS